MDAFRPMTSRPGVFGPQWGCGMSSKVRPEEAVREGRAIRRHRQLIVGREHLSMVITRDGACLVGEARWRQRLRCHQFLQFITPSTQQSIRPFATIAIQICVEFRAGCEFARLVDGRSRTRTRAVGAGVGAVRRYEPKPERRPDPKPERRPSARAGSRALATPYAELHCHSNASFLDGASPPEELVEEAANLGLEAIALTDRDGMYGVVRFAEAAKAFGMRTVFGAELTLGLASARPTLPDPDPPGEHLLVLARDPEGYARLCRAISTAQLAGSKGAPRAGLELLAGLHGGHWLVLTGCRKGAVPSALVEHGPAAAGYQLDRLIETFGRDNVLV